MMTAIAVAAALLATSAPPSADPLTTEIGALDAKVFDAYPHTQLTRRNDVPWDVAAVGVPQVKRQLLP